MVKYFTTVKIKKIKVIVKKKWYYLNSLSCQVSK